MRFPAAVRAGHGDHLHAFGPDQSLAHLASAGEKLVRATRQAGLLHVAADLDDRERAVFRRLGDDRVAGGEPTRHLVAPELDRIVERHDRHDHAKRLARRDGNRLLAAGDGIQRHRAAEDALRLLGIAAEDARGDADLAGRLADALAVLAAKQLSEFGLVRLDAPGDCLKDLVAPPGGHRRHRGLAALRGRDGAFDIGRTGSRHGRDLIVGGRVEHRIDGAVRCARPATVNQHVHETSSRRCAAVPRTVVDIGVVQK